MAVIETIAPIFLILVFGYIIQRKGFLTSLFISEINRFVFLFPLPVLIFTGIVKSEIKDVSIVHIGSVIIPTVMMVGVSLVLGVILRLKHGKLGTFVQTTFHGNVSYIGLAVLFYMFGEEGLKKGSLLIGILVLVNNALAIGVLSCTSHSHKGIAKDLVSIIKTPVIVATFAGIAMLYLKIQLPEALLKSMGILANSALPMALTIIGASITISTIKNAFALSALTSILKLMALPCLCILFCKIFSIPYGDAFPGIILLATPTATTSYILAHELGGDSGLASGAVTLSTLISPLTFILWGNMLT